MSKEEFIVNYLDDYVIMAYRKLTKKIDNEEERRLVVIMYNLMDMYVEGELQDYIHYNKIV